MVRPVEDMDMVERIKVPLNAARLKTLVVKLNAAQEEAESTRKPVVVDHPDTDDRIIRFVVTPK